MTDSIEAFQISLAAAETYEAMFVPALFGEWAPHMLDVSGVGRGQSVLDVGCGTGVVARAAAEAVGPAGRVVGLDLNDAMLTVARRVQPQVEWRQGDAAALPFEDATFDVVVCQAVLMFVPDPVQALREMGRVVRADGRVAVQVWASLAEQPAFRILVDVASEVAGPDAVDLLSTYFVHGDTPARNAMFDAAGLEIVSSVLRQGSMRFRSIDEFVRVEVEATPLVDRLSPDRYALLRDRARLALRGFETSEAGVELTILGHVTTLRPRAVAADPVVSRRAP